MQNLNTKLHVRKSVHQFHVAMCKMRDVNRSFHRFHSLQIYECYVRINSRFHVCVWGGTGASLKPAPPFIVMTAVGKCWHVDECVALTRVYSYLYGIFILIQLTGDFNGYFYHIQHLMAPRRSAHNLNFGIPYMNIANNLLTWRN